MKADPDLVPVLKKPIRLFARRPLVYACVLICVALAANVYRIRTGTLFACQADAYSSDRYIAYCNGKNYGDYEHGAFYFDLEASAENSAKMADVLFLGNSRLQVALSNTISSHWFSSVNTRYYLLGFSYDTNVLLAERLLPKISPQAKVYVINIDNFFSRHETPPLVTVFHDPKARERYESKRFWQSIHEPICKRTSWLCGNGAVVFRSRDTGAYIKRDPNPRPAPVSADQSIDQDSLKNETAAAINFVSHLPVERQCVILTMVPTVDAKIAKANAIARALGEDLVAPEVSPDLLTYDGSHLDRSSAERWSQAFFQMAGPRIRSCLEQRHAKRS
jgi:hypothetical protein